MMGLHCEIIQIFRSLYALLPPGSLRRRPEKCRQPRRPSRLTRPSRRPHHRGRPSRQRRRIRRRRRHQRMANGSCRELQGTGCWLDVQIWCCFLLELQPCDEIIGLPVHHHPAVRLTATHVHCPSPCRAGRRLRRAARRRAGPSPLGQAGAGTPVYVRLKGRGVLLSWF